MSYKMLFVLALIVLATPLAFAFYGYNCGGYYGYGYFCDDGDNDDSNPIELKILVDSGCTNVITVKASGVGVPGATVEVDGESIGTTDANGQIELEMCGDTVTIEAHKGGYEDGEKTVSLLDCGQCIPPECTTNEQCPDTEQCVNEECVPVPCECGQVQNHQCVAYQCCSNADCPTGQSCVGHQCKDDHECTTDLQCQNWQYCNIPPGQNGGSCKDLCEDGGSQCQCSEAKDHKLVPTGYDCGFPGCPECGEGAECVDHKCVQPDLSCICPDGSKNCMVGSSAACDALDCPNCDYEVTAPDGKKSTGQTGPDGSFDFPTNLEGVYRILLFKDGQPVKTVEVKAFPQSQPEEPEKPTSTGGDPFSLLWLLILLLLIILGIVYWRSRQQKK
jgi:hypothetical protein